MSMVEKSVKNYSGWCSQTTARVDFRYHYAGCQYTDTRMQICGYAESDMRIRIRRYGYADTDMRIRICGYGFADTDTRTRIRGHGYAVEEYGGIWEHTGVYGGIHYITLQVPNCQTK